MLHINYGITLVEVDDETCPMPEATYSTECSTPYALVLEATKIVPKAIEMGLTLDLHEPRAKRVLVEFEPFT